MTGSAESSGVDAGTCFRGARLVGRCQHRNHNLLNKLTGVNMPRGSVTQTRTFNYSLTTGWLTSATNPETGTVSYTYRADGSLASKTDAKNQPTTYTYDNYGRLTQASTNNPYGQPIPDSSYT